MSINDILTSKFSDLKTEDAKFECDALARRIVTPMTEPQLKENRPKAKNLPHTFQSAENDYV